jgi:hypothetical protein
MMPLEKSDNSYEVCTACGWAGSRNEAEEKDTGCCITKVLVICPKCDYEIREADWRQERSFKKQV